VLLKPAKRVSVGTRILFAEGCEAVIVERLSTKKWLLSFVMTIPFPRYLECYGKAPCRPISSGAENSSRPSDDLSRYQTVYARQPGSVRADAVCIFLKKSGGAPQRDVEVAPSRCRGLLGRSFPIDAEAGRRPCDGCGVPAGQ